MKIEVRQATFLDTETGKITTELTTVSGGGGSGVAAIITAEDNEEVCNMTSTQIVEALDAGTPVTVIYKAGKPYGTTNILTFGGTSVVAYFEDYSRQINADGSVEVPQP